MKRRVKFLATVTFWAKDEKALRKAIAAFKRERCWGLGSSEGYSWDGFSVSEIKPSQSAALHEEGK